MDDPTAVPTADPTTVPTAEPNAVPKPETVTGSQVFTEDMNRANGQLLQEKPAEPSNADPPTALKLSPNSLKVTDTKEFGKAILAEAREREKKARQDKVILEVQRLEASRLDYIRRQEFATEAIAWYTKKIAAIENGEFDFNLATCQMEFHDEDLEDANY